MLRNNLSILLETLQKAEATRKRSLGIASNQTLLKKFIKRNYETHKIMEKVLVSELISNGTKAEGIAIEKSFNKHGFRPDITVFSEGKYTFFECHHRDGFNRGMNSHIYNNLEIAKKLGRVIICLHKNKRRSTEYARKHDILRKADEVWFLDSQNKIEKIIN